MKKKLKPFHIFAAFSRVDEATRTVDAYAFVNEVVEGEGGIALKRTAMEAATPDYMQWANIRRMHQPDAVGIAENVTWDDTGALMTLKIVDDDAWEKVRTRVYKGLSVGVSATVMRGKDVIACKWFETSLVDRPKDPGAKFVAIRAEGIGDDEEHEVEVARADFSSAMAAGELWDKGYEAFDVLWGVLIDVCYSDDEDKEAQARTSIQQFADYVAPMVGGGVLPKRSANPDMTRLETALTTVTTENGALISRAQTAETELSRVQGLLSTVEGEVSELKRRKADIKPPIRYPQALSREFMANQTGDQDTQTESLQEELTRLETDLQNEPDVNKRHTGVQRMMVVKMELNRLGQSTSATH